MAQRRTAQRRIQKWSKIVLKNGPKMWLVGVPNDRARKRAKR